MVERAARVPSTRSRVRRVLFGVGVFLLGAGLLVVAFWAYLVWGTAVGQHAAQARLSTALARRYEVPTTSSPTTEPRAPTPSGPFVWPALGNGDPVARLVIPRIGLDMVVVEGTDTADLREGPGHYPTTPLPGQAGNVAIAGHRTTYAHPFYNLNELSPGDVIELSVPGHDWRYLVTTQLVVAPTDVAVAGPLGPGSWLTLTTCNPRVLGRHPSGRASPARPHVGPRRRTDTSVGGVPGRHEKAPCPPSPTGVGRPELVARDRLGGARGSRCRRRCGRVASDGAEGVATRVVCGGGDRRVARPLGAVRGPGPPPAGRLLSRCGRTTW